MVIGLSITSQGMQRGRVKLLKITNSIDLIEVAPSIELPNEITAISTNFRDLNEILIGCDKYLFLFRVTEPNEIENPSFSSFTIKCQKFIRVRASIRSLEWHFALKTKKSKKPSKKKEEVK